MTVKKKTTMKMNLRKTQTKTTQKQRRLSHHQREDNDLVIFIHFVPNYNFCQNELYAFHYDTNGGKNLLFLLSSIFESK